MRQRLWFPATIRYSRIRPNGILPRCNFYEAILSVEIVETELGPNKMGWFPMEMGAAGAAGTLIMGDGFTPSHDGSLVYLHVDKIDPTLNVINGAGGKTLMPRLGIGEHGFIAHFEDTEGNRVALHESP